MRMNETIRVLLKGAQKLANGEKDAYFAGDFNVLVCRVNGQLFAVENQCSHAESELCDGLLHGHLIICPLHGAAFDVRDGQHKSPPAFSGIRTFPIHESTDSAEIEVPNR